MHANPPLRRKPVKFRVRTMSNKALCFRCPTVPRWLWTAFAAGLLWGAAITGGLFTCESALRAGGMC